MTTQTITREQQFGIYAQIGNAWEKGDYRRVYFNDAIERAADFLAGLSKTRARRIRNSLAYAKFYFDANDGKLYTTYEFGANAEAAQAVFASLRAERDAIIAANAERATRSMASDPTTPAGATREASLIRAIDAGWTEASLIRAIDAGWTEAEIAAGVRFKGRETFICAGCGLEFPRSLAMSASLGTSCPDCYDDLSG